MARLPYMQFYVADYLLDTQPLSLLARGVWTDTLFFMWRAEPKGVLCMPVDKWCKLLRCSEADFLTAVTEFRAHNICKIAKDDIKSTVRLVSRRMQREEKDKERNRLYVQRHRDRKACKTNESQSKPENQNRIRTEQNQNSPEAYMPMPDAVRGQLQKLGLTEAHVAGLDESR